MPLIIISFIAGVLTILAPCILPLLPVIVGRSISDSTVSTRRVFVVISSLGISVILFTLILKVSTIFVNIPQDFWRYISSGIIFIFGLITIFPSLWENISFTALVSQRSNKVLMQGYQKNSVWGDVIVGASLGPIFSACSPTYFVILATVLPANFFLGVLYLFVYTLGLCLALLVVSLLGQKITSKLNFAVDGNGWFKKALGVLFIIVAIGIFTGYDKKFQISILNAGFFDVTKVEQGLLAKNTNTNTNTQTDSESTVKDNVNKETTTKTLNSNTEKVKFLTLEEKSKKFTLAPDISTPDGFVNTDGKPITISEFKGKKVVLLDIWTYSCINCQRTIPYLNDWYSKYKDKGLVIIGLHTPEFSFERVQKNVEEATKSLGIKYPVVLDNDFSTWNAYHNQFWPREYLIDIDGYVVHDHAGEGGYAESEKAIQDALAERASRLGLNDTMPTITTLPKDVISINPNMVNSPETYFGSARNEYLANGISGANGIQILYIPATIEPNKLYLGGVWNFTSEYAESSGEVDGVVVFKYNAKNVYIVASSNYPGEDGADVDVYIDGVLDNTVHIKDEKLYQIIKGTDYREHTLKLIFSKPGIKAFTFTFG